MNAARLSQYMTPAWAPERLLERTFREVHLRSCVAVDPTCGTGSFMAAFPRTATVFGIEIDPRQARIARKNTGRTVICSDFQVARLPQRVQIIAGNPPFKVALFDELVGFADRWLEPGGTMAMILPAHFFKSAARVLEYRDRWSIKAELLPYSALYPLLRYPLVWAVFQRGGKRLVGFALYSEARDIQGMRAIYRKALEAPGLTWREVVRLAILSLGGEANLDAIYKLIQPHRPSGNPWWKEQIRKQAQTFTRTAPSTYAVAA